VTRQKSGKLVEMKKEETVAAAESAEVSRLMASIGTAIFTEKAVKAGESWETEVVNPLVKDKKVKIKTTFIGVDKLEGLEVWKVKQTAEADTDPNGGKLTYEATFWLDTANGQEARSDVTVIGLPSMYGNLTIKTKALRVKPAEKSDK
jgi:hypothetical protein